MNALFLTVTFLVVTSKVHLNLPTVPCFACFLSFLFLIPFVQLMIHWSKQLACSWFAQVVFGSISFPDLSLSNTNNVHNTYFIVATLIHAVKSSISLSPQGFSSLKEQCQVFLMLLTLQMRWNILINAENNRFFDTNECTFLHRKISRQVCCFPGFSVT